MHHTGHESGELVVVGEHQFGDADSVVFVYYRNDIIFKHYPHASTLVVKLLSRFKILLHGEYLSHMHVVLAEEVVVQTYEFHLSESGEELTLFYCVEVMADLQFPSSASHGS